MSYDLKIHVETWGKLEESQKRLGALQNVLAEKEAELEQARAHGVSMEAKVRSLELNLQEEQENKKEMELQWKEAIKGEQDAKAGLAASERFASHLSHKLRELEASLSHRAKIQPLHQQHRKQQTSLPLVDMNNRKGIEHEIKPGSSEEEKGRSFGGSSSPVSHQYQDNHHQQKKEEKAEEGSIPSSAAASWLLPDIMHDALPQEQPTLDNLLSSSSPVTTPSTASLIGRESIQQQQVVKEEEMIDTEGVLPAPLAPPSICSQKQTRPDTASIGRSRGIGAAGGEIPLASSGRPETRGGGSVDSDDNSNSNNIRRRPETRVGMICGSSTGSSTGSRPETRGAAGGGRTQRSSSFSFKQQHLHYQCSESDSSITERSSGHKDAATTASFLSSNESTDQRMFLPLSLPVLKCPRTTTTVANNKGKREGDDGDDDGWYPFHGPGQARVE